MGGRGGDGHLEVAQHHVHAARPTRVRALGPRGLAPLRQLVPCAACRPQAHMCIRLVSRAHANTPRTTVAAARLHAPTGTQAEVHAVGAGGPAQNSLCIASRPVLAFTLNRHTSIPGHSIAAVRAL